jgi:hypothetical protein
MRTIGRMSLAGILVVLLGAARQSQPALSIPVFPADNPWNWDISGLAVHPNSDNYIATMVDSTHGLSTPIREDYSFPYSVVSAGQANVTVTFGSYFDESDPGPGFGSPAGGTGSTGKKGSYPIPAGAPIEGGGAGDAHVLVINKDTALLYETYQTSGGPPWTAACGAVFDLNSNAVRPDGWTSGDAAGLPIFPGLIRYDEVSAGAITHALRVTFPTTQNHHIYPARHDAGSSGGNLPPMGLRIRLKASKDISGYTGEAKVVLTALKKYGLLVADNGSAWYISTTVDSNWTSTNIQQIRKMVASDFEVVTSVDASGNPILPVSGGGSGPPPPPGGGSSNASGGGGGGGGGGGCGLIGLELLPLLLLRRARRHA